MPYKSKDAHAAQARRWRKANAASGKKSDRRKLLKRYGLTEQAFDNMLAAQEGKCLICRKKSDKQFHVDHDHQTGKVRGLLCGNCNLALGLLYESPENFYRAYEYLLEHTDN